MLGYLALPMSVGSVLGAIVGGGLAVWSPTTLLRMIFAVILAVSAAKLLAAKPKLPRETFQIRADVGAYTGVLAFECRLSNLMSAAVCGFGIGLFLVFALATSFFPEWGSDT
jgi:uncharacterized membrane protein YfcA